MSINRVILTGNLTRDPEIRRTQTGMAIMSLGIAVNDRRKNNQTGEWEDYANFIDCTMFGTRAEAVSNYLHKGSKVGIDGKLRYSTWENKDGQKRSKLEVIVDDLELLSPRNSQGGYQGNSGGYQGGNAGGYQGGTGGYQGGNAGGYQPAPAPAVDTTSSVYDDDIPF
jgi:single-strand DNA-binding protein